MIICSINTERGGRPGFLDYVRALGEHKQPEIILFQEVHRSFDPSLPEEVDLNDRPGYNSTPIRPHLFEELGEALPGYTSWFAPQIVGHYHDVCARDVDVAYGQAMFVREGSQLVVASQASEVVYRQFSEQNNEVQKEDGTWTGGLSAKSAQAVTVYVGNSSLVVANTHGPWSVRGKVDLPARLEYNQGLNRLLMGQVGQLGDHAEQNVLLLGDLNYVTGMQALKNLRCQGVFGANGSGVCLNHEFGLKETRTKFYPASKPHREADFGIVSSKLVPSVTKVYVDMHTPSDHAAYFVELDL
ncbi:hypothetical protein CL653_01495 [bacterium]|nr:hypothetical protein [bacterium]